MNGSELSDLMRNGELKAQLLVHARRYSKNTETQEEYIQDAWLRIANERGGLSIDHYEEEGRKAIKAAYYRGRYRVQKNKAENLYSKGEGVPKTAIPLVRGRWLDTKPEKLDPWYYDGEWLDLGLDKNHYATQRFYRIILPAVLSSHVRAAVPFRD